MRDLELSPNGGITRRTLLTGAGALGLLATTPARLHAQVGGGQYLFGSATLGSTGYVIIEGLSTIINRHSGLRSSSQSTSGGAENVALIGQGLLDFGQSTSVDLVAAREGAAPYGTPIDVQQMFCYTTFALPPIVHADSEIRAFEDLRGKRVSPGAAGGTTAQSWRLMFEESAIGDDVRWTFGSWREIYDGFMAGNIDCIPAILTALRPSPIVVELTTNYPVRPVSFPDALIARAQEENPGIMRFEVTPETWPHLSEPAVASGSSGILAANPNVSPEAAYAMTKAVFENVADLHTISNVLTSVKLEDATRYLVPGVPVNAGAAQYFKEQNVWRDDLVEG
ncbi:TAXI family TRAP transporter solute-binding subunit [Salinarimonas rosea]|uniref:TAXI family TRAP transporter solute-binding subunit n=1 Tax=Salinarimonas rosea TaxID=552063 RepID=UPI0003FB2BB6|nr:TAXI family TRAP transporter solute-binding subunit [Salinarimonas rosea]